MYTISLVETEVANLCILYLLSKHLWLIYVYYIYCRNRSDHSMYTISLVETEVTNLCILYLLSKQEWPIYVYYIYCRKRSDQSMYTISIVVTEVSNLCILYLWSKQKCPIYVYFLYGRNRSVIIIIASSHFLTLSCNDILLGPYRQKGRVTCQILHSVRTFFI